MRLQVSRVNDLPRSWWKVAREWPTVGLCTTLAVTDRGRFTILIVKCRWSR